MQESELAEETKSEAEQNSPIETIVGVTGSVNAIELQQRVSEVLSDLPSNSSWSRVAVAYPGNGTAEVGAASDGTLPSLLPYSLPAPEPANLPWTIASAAQRAICSLAAQNEAKVCIVLHGDLVTLRADTLELLAHPIVEKECDLVLPVYSSRKFEGLLNHSILSPLARVLYGKRVRYPLAPDWSCSARMFTRLAEASDRSEYSANPHMWPTTLAALGDYQMCQVNLDAHHATQTEGLELSTVLTSLVGSAYLEMETYAAQWQSVRGSHATATWGSAAAQIGEGDPVDVKPLIDSFLLGSHNLQEVWSLVLPPVTSLELKKLARSSPESFRMQDELWVRIIYDFALAHRLRTISRGHLLGALTPLYLGWVASYVQEVANASPLVAEQRLERLARAYEDGKPYLLSRWRWPDRFNP